jgi:flagellar basal body-associated protein FliL
MKNQQGSIVVIVLVLIVLLLIAGGAFYFYSLSQKNSSTAVDTPVVSQEPTESAKATTKETDLTTQLNSVQLEEIDKSFSSLDQDLNNL